MTAHRYLHIECGSLANISITIFFAEGIGLEPMQDFSWPRFSKPAALPLAQPSIPDYKL